MTEARRLLARLHVLDRQLVDRDGQLAGRVDDVELAVPEDGSPPHVAAILSGPGTLGRRLGGRLGRLAEKVSLRLTGDPPGTGRIPIESVADLGSHITLSRGRRPRQPPGRALGRGDRHPQAARWWVVMKLSEVLGAKVVTTDGVELGKVRDIWLRQDGPLLGLWGHALRIDALVVSRHTIGFDLGLRHGSIEGPKVLMALARRLPEPRTIPWDQVISLGQPTVVRAR